MRPPKIMCDMTSAAHDISGLPQEARLLFQMFAHTDAVECAGFIIPSKRELLSLCKGSPLLNQALLLFGWTTPDKRKFGLMRIIRTIQEAILFVFQAIKKMLYSPTTVQKFELQPLFADALWRVLFSASLPASSRKKILSKPFYFSYLNLAIIDRDLGKRSKGRFLKIPTEFDFLILQNRRHISIPDSVIKIVRIPDSVALEAPDTSPSAWNIAATYEFMQTLQTNMIVCCITQTTRDTLLKICPKINENNVFVIPPNIQHFTPQPDTARLVRDIILTKKNAALWDTLPHVPVPETISYILSISTLEPRKNYLRLINNWANIRKKTGKDIKLVIVGGQGWNNSAILQEMQPHMLEGNLFHLSNLSKDQLEIMLSNAMALAFLSYLEGFGCAPLEAMQCGCPTLSSDIPVHREVYGDATYYCDPYDDHDIETKLTTLLDVSADSEALRQSLIAKGIEHVKRYSDDRILQQWLAMFHTLQERQKVGKVYF